MTDEFKSRKIDVLGKVSLNFERSKIAYENYIREGKIYLHARILKESNQRIRDLLLENAHILKNNLRDDAVDLITHYDIWFEMWNDLKQKIAPELYDVFIFENKFKFPKEAEKRLKEEFSKIKKLN
jgi:hypothetical protein|tara:strand:- start:3327 stop:3704 length:378 start_codon:yes stop_codon:yes gene_type:complete